MSKLSIVYWSGTGNTEEMANFICEGGVSKGLDVTIKPVDEANIDDVKNSDIIALGCPAMGNEVLEESTMEPFIDSIAEYVKGKNVVLFGSYGWGDGQWMRDWEERMKDIGAVLVQDSLLVNEAPDSEDDKNNCIEFGKNLCK